MEIYFRTKALQKVCSLRKEAVKKLGPEMALKLQLRLTQLLAAANLSEIERVPPARCHELGGDRKGQLSVDLRHPFRLIFVPANQPVPYRGDGGLDWDQVTEIEVIEIVDTH